VVQQLTLGVLGRSRKQDERRLPIHPAHFDRIDDELRERIFVEAGYGERFGVPDEELARLAGGVLPRAELISRCEVVVLPKPDAADLAELREGQVLWGWPHCVQDEALTQAAIDRRLTVMAWEAMNLWSADGAFAGHVFHRNNELAGYCSVMHALELVGKSGQYGRDLRAAVISFGATARGAVTALDALGIRDITVLTQRAVAAVASPIPTVRFVNFDRMAQDPRRVLALEHSGLPPLAAVLAEHDVIVNCVLQDTDAPIIFVMNEELGLFARGTLFVDVSIDEGMGFEWARPTTFADPMFTVGDGAHYYAVDHSPSHLWDAATWEISEALLAYLPVVMAGPREWDGDDTIARSIEIRDGVVQNPRILSFQGRSGEYPHAKL
jgi:alanine dehydrogenase